MDNSLDLPTVERESVTDQVYTVLKDAIYQFGFVPGQKLDLVELQEQMGISRMPLYLALQRLATERLVVIRPKSGTYVVDLELWEIEQLGETCLALEVWAADRAIQNLSEDQLDRLRDMVSLSNLRARAVDVGHAKPNPFIPHSCAQIDINIRQLLFEAAGNQVMIEVWDKVFSLLLLAIARGLRSGSKIPIMPLAQHHVEILEAVEARDIRTLKDVLAKVMDLKLIFIKERMEQGEF